MTTIRDIAKMANCSVSTVSRVLNQHPYVAEVKRQEILAIIQATNYVPNNQAIQLSIGETQNIGVILPNTQLPFFEKILAGIMQAAFEQQYKITLLPTNYQPKLEKQYLAYLQNKTLDGLIITSKSLSFETIQECTKYGPIVCCEDTENFMIPCVYTNQYQSFIAAFQYMQALKKQHVAVTIHRDASKSPTTRKTIAAFQEVYGQQTTPIIFDHCKTFDDGQKAAKFFLKQAKKIDAILTNGDEIAAGIIKIYQQQKQTALIIGQENLPYSQLLDFPTIDHQLNKLGQQAFSLCIKKEMKKIAIPFHFKSKNKMI